MPKKLNEILSLEECRKWIVIGGSGGLRKSINWVVRIGALSDMGFCEPGDLGVLVSAEQKSGEELLHIMEAALRQKLCAVAFVCGKGRKLEEYDAVISFSDVHDLPIFVMPEDTKISVCIRSIGQFIAWREPEDNNPGMLLQTILLGSCADGIAPKAIRAIKNCGLYQRKRYQVILVKMIESSNTEVAAEAKNYDALLEQFHKLFWMSGISVPMEHGLAIIMKDDAVIEASDVKRIGALKNIDAEMDCCSGLEVRIGAGGVYQTLEDISKSYQEALLVTKIFSSRMQKEKMLYLYTSIGFFRILAESPDRKRLYQFCGEKIGPLEEYDNLNHSELLPFLEAYFNSNCNVKGVSEAIFMHKNTVLYKLRKIEGILGCDFSKIEDIVELKIALMIREIYGA